MEEAHSSRSWRRGAESFHALFLWNLGMSPTKNITCSPTNDASVSRVLLGSYHVISHMIELSLYPVSLPWRLGMGLKIPTLQSCAGYFGCGQPLL